MEAAAGQGFHDTVVAKHWPVWTDETRLSSQSAGALWKSLPLGCGPQAVLDSLRTNQPWTLESHRICSAMVKIPISTKAVELRPCTTWTTDENDANPVVGPEDGRD